MKFLVQLAVWGKEFIDFFSEYSLPSQLVGNNFDYLSQKADVTYWFFTFRESRKYLEEKESFQRLKELVSIKIIEIDSISVKCKYKTLLKCSQIISREGIRQNCPVIYLYPDGVYSHNVMKKIYEAILKGKRALVYPAFRVKKDAMLLELQKLVDFKEKGITAKELLEKSFSHFHNEVESFFWNQSKITLGPARLIWQLDKSIYLHKVFHIHPFCIWAEKDVLPTDSVDGVFTHEAVSMDKIEVIKDTSEMTVVDLSPPFLLNIVERSFYKIAQWLRKNTNAESRKMFCHNFYFSLKPIQKEKYKVDLTKIKKIEKRIFRTVKFYYFFHYAKRIKNFFSSLFLKGKLKVFSSFLLVKENLYRNFHLLIIKALRKILRFFVSEKRRKKIKQYLYIKKGLRRKIVEFWENR